MQNQQPKSLPKSVPSSGFTTTKDGEVVRLLGTKRCPKCGKLRAMSHFGMRRMKKTGIIRPQAWCKTCR